VTYLLGIDGGGTRTTAWLADLRGRVSARAEAGPSNPLKVGVRTAQREIVRAARLAWNQVRGSKSRLDAICLGLAGVDRAPVYRVMLKWMEQVLPARLHLLASDAEIALTVALGQSAGVLVIAGTGSIGYARDSGGHLHRSGGFGSLFDDAGSGCDLGRKAVTAALRSFDGRGEHTLLMPSICRALALKSIADAAAVVMAAHELAALFPLVVAAGRRGDNIARRLCGQAGADLAELALALLRRLDWLGSDVPVACSGGVFRSSLLVRRSFSAHLLAHAPHVRITLLARDPVEGALLLARSAVQTGVERCPGAAARHLRPTEELKRSASGDSIARRS
jgi:N-acetylglucosamine kinase-like BadF-type ATPase